MKFNFGKLPPAILVTVGAESFTLQHQYLTGFERAQVIESLSSLSMLAQLLGDKIINWVNVCGEDGTALAFEHLDAQGRKIRNLDQLWSHVPWLAQLRVLLVQMSMNGVRLERGRERGLIENFAGGGEIVAELQKELDGFFGSASGTEAQPSAK